MSDKMPTPSRDLIEHMLRAMGWTFHAPYWWDPSQNRCLVGRPDTDILKQLCFRDERLVYVLGLCAAADKCITCAAGLGSLETEFGRTYAQALRDCGEGHLRMAGIDPNAWEKTR